MSSESPVVLIVEDESLISMMVREVFELEGIACIAASSLDGARALAANRSFSAALLDVNVRGEVVFPLALELERGGTPCILVSGYDPETVPREFAHVAFFQKPFDPEELVAAVTDLIRSA